VTQPPVQQAPVASPVAPPAPAAAPAIDPRDARVDAVCDRLDREIAASPERVRDFLGKPGETVGTLRRTCHDLLRRERTLRAEAAPEELDRLEREAKALQSRIDAETDDIVRDRLRGAVQAIEEQGRQRALLLRNANRLEAEFTRLSWTLESLVAQIIRLRSADAASGDLADAELHKGLSRLREEVDAVAEALEQVNEGDARAALQPALAPPAEPPLKLDPSLMSGPGAVSEGDEAEGARRKEKARGRGT
jgi:hypothetical protein